MCAAIPPLPNTPYCRGAQLRKSRDYHWKSEKNLKERDHTEELGIDGRILERILGK